VREVYYRADDEGSSLLWNVGLLQWHKGVLYPKKQPSSQLHLLKDLFVSMIPKLCHRPTQ
jgi:hypothetical protein